jgi:hypothetical protein
MSNVNEHLWKSKLISKKGIFLKNGMVFQSGTNL